MRELLRVCSGAWQVLLSAFVALLLFAHSGASFDGSSFGAVSFTEKMMCLRVLVATWVAILGDTRQTRNSETRDQNTRRRQSELLNKARKVQLIFVGKQQRGVGWTQGGHNTYMRSLIL